MMHVSVHAHGRCVLTLEFDEADLVWSPAQVEYALDDAGYGPVDTIVYRRGPGRPTEVYTRMGESWVSQRDSA